MECPVCELVSPAAATTCDCGYDFIAQTGGKRPPFHKRYRAVLILVAIVMGWALMSLVTLYLHSSAWGT
jgi:hypothetical protein